MENYYVLLTFTDGNTQRFYFSDKGKAYAYYEYMIDFYSYYLGLVIDLYTEIWTGTDPQGFPLFYEYCLETFTVGGNN